MKQDHLDRDWPPNTSVISYLLNKYLWLVLPNTARSSTGSVYSPRSRRTAEPTIFTPGIWKWILLQCSFLWKIVRRFFFFFFLNLWRNCPPLWNIDHLDLAGVQSQKTKVSLLIQPFILIYGTWDSWWAVLMVKIETKKHFSVFTSWITRSPDSFRKWLTFSLVFPLLLRYLWQSFLLTLTPLVKLNSIWVLPFLTQSLTA